MWDVLSNDAAVEFVKQKLAELPDDGKLSSVCEAVLDRYFFFFSFSFLLIFKQFLNNVFTVVLFYFMLCYLVLLY